MEHLMRTFGGASDRTFGGTFEGTFGGAFHGAFDGAFDGTFDGTFGGTFDGAFDGAFDETLDGAFDGCIQMEHSMELLLMDVSSVRQQPEPAPVECVVRPDRPLHDRQLDGPAASAPHVVGRRAHGGRPRAPWRDRWRRECARNTDRG